MRVICFYFLQYQSVNDDIAVTKFLVQNPRSGSDLILKLRFFTERKFIPVI